MASDDGYSHSCLVLIVDESSAMQSPLARTPGSPANAVKTKAESAATAINSLLQKLSAGALEMPVAIVGYRAGDDGLIDIGCRWGGALAGYQFVNSAQLRTAPLRVEQRDRNRGGAIDRVEFPVWYEPKSVGKAPQVAAFQFCRDLLSEYQASAANAVAGPLMIHISAGSGDDGNPSRAVAELLQMAGWAAPPLIFHAYLGSHDSVPATFLPANRAYLTLGSMRDLFERSSEVPSHMANMLRDSGVNVLRSARGMVFNGRMLELVQLLSTATAEPPRANAESGAVASSDVGGADLGSSLNTTSNAGGNDYAGRQENQEQILDSLDAPEAAIGSVSREQPALLVFVADRSVSDPFDANLSNACRKIQDELGKIIYTLHARGGGAVDVAVVSYGADAEGNTEVRTTLEGGLQGKTFAGSEELYRGAVRVEESIREEPNGVGGLMRIPLNRIHLVDLEASAAGAASKCFEQVKTLVDEWVTGHPGTAVPPLIIHLTRGNFESADLQSATSWFTPSSRTSLSPRLYHMVLPEGPAEKLEYCDSADEISDGSMVSIWNVTSELYGWRTLAEERPAITARSRGLVVNGNIRLALEPILNAIAD